MSENISTEYKGITISYSENWNEWENKVSGRRYRSLALAKESIDRAEKINNRMEAIPVIQYKTYWSKPKPEYIHSEITSFASASKVWIREAGKKGRGSTLDIPSFSVLFQETSENWEKIEKILALYQNITELKKQIELIEKSLVPVDIAAHHQNLLKAVQDTEDKNNA